MIKQFSLIAITAAMLSACGGSSDSGGTPDWSTASSAPSSSQASEPASSDDSSSSSSVPSVDASFSFEEGIDGWYVYGTGNTETIKTTEIELAHNMVESTLEFIPIDWSQIADKNWIYQARMDFDETIDLTGSRVEFTVSIPDTYVTDATLELQIIVHAEDSANTDYATNILLSSLTKNDDGDYVIDRDTDLTTAIGIGFQVSKAPADANLKESIHIKSLLIDRPEGSGSSSSSSEDSSNTALSIDFESDTAGDTYASTGWAAEDLTATVVAISSVTAGDGLPANGSSVNVLQIKPTNYNAVPLFDITLPDGKTLADYTVQVDAYFPHSSLGLAEDGNNAYKDFFLLAGETVSSGANADNVAYQSTYATTGADIDTWKTLELSVDATKGALLTGKIQIALGISRPAAGTGISDDYYFDNIKLVEIE